YNHLKSFTGRARLTVQPLSDSALTSRVDVPEAGKYRIWLCYLADIGNAHPLHLSLAGQTLTFNEAGLPGNDTGAQQEAKRPIRFESEMARIAPPRNSIFIWEFRDVELPADRHVVELRAKPGDVRVDTLFITRSK